MYELAEFKEAIDGLNTANVHWRAILVLELMLF